MRFAVAVHGANQLTGDIKLAGLRRTSLKKPRLKAFHSQSGKCYYCQQPIWIEGPEKYAAMYGISLRQASLMMCTGEHLIAHKDGGSSGLDNIVAACHYCNIKRHTRKKDLSPIEYKLYVSKRLHKGRWHRLVLEVVNA